MGRNGKSERLSGKNQEAIHQPVLLEEVLHWLSPVDGGIYVDGNVGLGGHSAAILKACSPGGRVIGIDWDAEALQLAKKNLEPYKGRIELHRGNFTEIGEVLKAGNISLVDGILLDLGLSSLQIDHSCRGFSFQRDEPLDMRMDCRERETASDLINNCTETELADIFYYYGEERQARRISAAIVKARKSSKIIRTSQLVEVIERAVPKRFHPKKIHVATKVFQALRIAVNKELDNLETIVTHGSQYLRPGGRFCIISFHSLEDRLVKRGFNIDKSLKVLTSKPVMATQEERNRNPRSRSAKMRVAAVRERIICRD